MTDTLPPDPEGLNGYRAQRAGCALAHYLEFAEGDHDDTLRDLLCDLMHLCDRDQQLCGFDAQLERARQRYELETTPDKS